MAGSHERRYKLIGVQAGTAPEVRVAEVADEGSALADNADACNVLLSHEAAGNHRAGVRRDADHRPPGPAQLLGSHVCKGP